jgi:CheY-like chemotaxis protein
VDKNDLVLIVDDEKSCREVLRTVLELFKVRVIEASSGFTGRDLARTHRPALIFMDLNMPEMDGFEASRAIHNDPDLGNTPIIAMSANDTRLQKSKAFNAGCIEWLPKPWEFSEVFGILERFLWALELQTA